MIIKKWNCLFFPALPKLSAYLATGINSSGRLTRVVSTDEFAPNVTCIYTRASISVVRPVGSFRLRIYNPVVCAVPDDAIVGPDSRPASLRLTCADNNVCVWMYHVSGIVFG